MTPAAAPATWDPELRGWRDGRGQPLTGHHPLAQLGVGGRYVAPQDGRTYTIVEIRLLPDARGRNACIVRAMS